MQGDLPTLAPELVKKTADLLQDGSDMASLVAEIKDPSEIDNPNVVKAIVSWDEASTEQEKVGRGLYFTVRRLRQGMAHIIIISGFTAINAMRWRNS